MYRLHGFFTQNTLKTLYVLEQLEADFEFKFVDLFKGENRTDEFRRMNPAGKVPVLEDDGFILFESGAICRYLGNVANSSLYPSDPRDRARVDQWMDFFTCHPGFWLSTLFFEKNIRPQAGLGDTDTARCEEAVKLASQQLRAVDGELAGRRYLAGDELSIADLFAFAYLEQADSVDFPLQPFSHLSEWYEQLDALPAVERARAVVRQ